MTDETLLWVLAHAPILARYARTAMMIRAGV